MLKQYALFFIMFVQSVPCSLHPKAKTSCTQYAYTSDASCQRCKALSKYSELVNWCSARCKPQHASILQFELIWGTTQTYNQLKHIYTSMNYLENSLFEISYWCRSMGLASTSICSTALNWAARSRSKEQQGRKLLDGWYIEDWLQWKGHTRQIKKEQDLLPASWCLMCTLNMLHFNECLFKGTQRP